MSDYDCLVEALAATEEYRNTQVELEEWMRRHREVLGKRDAAGKKCDAACRRLWKVMKDKDLIRSNGKVYRLVPQFGEKWDTVKELAELLVENPGTKESE